jgi:hypothetical protein
MNARRIAVAAAALTLSVGAGSALACGGPPMPMTMPWTASLTSTLKSTYAAAHHGVRTLRLTRTHSGTIMGDRYAVATVTVNGRRTEPTIFVRHNGRGSWRITRVTHGAVCGRYVPVPLLELWHMHRLPDTDCYVEQRA